jgi:hypothetical protein
MFTTVKTKSNYYDILSVDVGPFEQIFTCLFSGQVLYQRASRLERRTLGTLSLSVSCFLCWIFGGKIHTNKNCARPFFPTPFVPSSPLSAQQAPSLMLTMESKCPRLRRPINEIS